MKIQRVAVVGTGAVGASLARNLVGHGISVQVASRDADQAKALATSLGDKARAATVASLGEGVDAVFLCVPADAAPAVLEEAAKLVAGTVVVDCTNPLTWSEGPVAAPPAEGSMTAHLAKRFAKLRLLKAFNTFGAEFHERPALGTSKADLYLAGENAEAKQGLADLARTLGYDPVDVGPLRNAQHLESLAVLWIHMATVGGRGRDVAFKLLPR